MLRLVDLDPVFLGAGGPGIYRDGAPLPERHGVGLSFNCPCGNHEEEHRCFILFRNPLDGGPSVVEGATPSWQREGDTFETLSTQPSILRNPARGGCGWHGYITNGEILTC